MKYRVTLTADAYMSAWVEIEASNAAEAEAKSIAYGRGGNASWEYNGINENRDIEAQDITEVTA